MILFIYSFLMLGIQAPSGSGGPPPPRPGNVVNNPQLPIDENIWVLIAAGIVFGVYIFYKKNQTKTTNKVS